MMKNATICLTEISSSYRLTRKSFTDSFRISTERFYELLVPFHRIIYNKASKSHDQPEFYKHNIQQFAYLNTAIITHFHSNAGVSSTPTNPAIKPVMSSQQVIRLKDAILNANAEWTTTIDDLNRSLATDLEACLVVPSEVQDRARGLPAHVASALIRRFLAECYAGNQSSIQERDNSLVSIVHGFTCRLVERFSVDIRNAKKTRDRKINRHISEYTKSIEVKTAEDHEVLGKLIEELDVSSSTQDKDESSSAEFDAAFDAAFDAMVLNDAKR
ncbi:uncharacterized protein RAG0_08531 [Rhynchosporium agropyri]|uniref:Uncharacterized protein n=1 Tax=Rhynchosporium agropyri TaxID=914238 RepID=A0A1E1KR82_9HELO|nr:uncharacterized protein RAG0_08531 [Rhynchosporium agropyri]